LCIEVHKKIARIYHDQDELEKALDSLMDACRDFPAFITPMGIFSLQFFSYFPHHFNTLYAPYFVELNLIMELCLTLKNYLEALNVLIAFSGIVFEPPLPEAALEGKRNAMAALGDTKRLCTIPSDLHRDLVHKLVIIFVHLEAFHLANVRTRQGVFLSI